MWKLCTYYTKVKDGDATMAVLKTWDNSVITPIYASDANVVKVFLHSDLGTRDFCLFESSNLNFRKEFGVLWAVLETDCGLYIQCETRCAYRETVIITRLEVLRT